MLRVVESKNSVLRCFKMLSVELKWKEFYNLVVVIIIIIIIVIVIVVM